MNLLFSFRNILENNSKDQGSRWSAENNNPPQVRTQISEELYLLHFNNVCFTVHRAETRKVGHSEVDHIWKI